ncbi:Adaptin ear-binding coat-associated protein 1 [Halotydeus destructor]|nr:Adaptin ear-binding coat-associated protein 1 [Halotydeus destructor]
MGEEYERILLVKPDVFIYKIPPRTSNRGYRASDWKLDEPDWTGRMRIVAVGKKCIIKIEDKSSGQLFAQCPIDKYPSVSLEAVSDSSRYFVLKIVNDNGQSAFIGIGFADRGDSFDVNVALQDHFKWVEKQDEIDKGISQEDPNVPKLDLKFKEGQTIKVNLNLGKKTSRPKPKGTSGILPPPPGGGAIKIPAPGASLANPSQPPTDEVTSKIGIASDLLADFDGLTVGESKSENSQSTSESLPSSAGTGWAQF